MRTYRLSRVDAALVGARCDRHCCKGGGKSGKGKGGGGGGGSSEEEPAPSGPKLPEGVRKDEVAGVTYYSFNMDGNSVQLKLAPSNDLRNTGQQGSTVSFEVNGGFDREGLSQRSSDAIALRLMRVMRHDASTRPNGYRYDTTAYTTDGFGSRRAQAYERIGGFSRPVGGQSGANQFGIVRNGRIVPDTDRLQASERQARRSGGS